MEPNVYDIASQNLTLPHDVVQLPTGGKFYKSKKKSVKVGYLTAIDENILTSALQGRQEEIVLNLLRNKLYERDVKPEELLDGDIEALLIFLRNTSFGPEYVVNLTDPKTQKRFEATIILDELNIKNPNIEPNEEG